MFTHIQEWLFQYTSALQIIVQNDEPPTDVQVTLHHTEIEKDQVNAAVNQDGKVVYSEDTHDLGSFTYAV